MAGFLHTDWHLGRHAARRVPGRCADALSLAGCPMVREGAAWTQGSKAFGLTIVQARGPARRCARADAPRPAPKTDGNHDGRPDVREPRWGARLGLFADMPPSLHVVTGPEAIGAHQRLGRLVYPMCLQSPTSCVKVCGSLEPSGKADLPLLHTLPPGGPGGCPAPVRADRWLGATRRRAPGHRDAARLRDGAQTSDSERDYRRARRRTLRHARGRSPGPRPGLRGGRAPAPPQDIGASVDPLRRLPIMSRAGATSQSPSATGRHLDRHRVVPGIPVNALQGIAVLRGTMDELLADPRRAHPHLRTCRSRSGRRRRMVRAFAESTLVVTAPRRPLAGSAMAVRASRDPREVTEGSLRAVGGRALSAGATSLPLDVWAQLRERHAVKIRGVAAHCGHQPWAEAHG